MDYWRAPDEAKNPRNDYPELIKPFEEIVQKPLL
jgi:hypothetical protein